LSFTDSATAHNVSRRNLNIAPGVKEAAEDLLKARVDRIVLSDDLPFRRLSLANFLLLPAIQIASRLAT
jgi:hypothetical protein